MIQSLIKKHTLAAFSLIEYGALELHCPDGEIFHFQGKYSGAQAKLTLNSWKVIINLARKSDVGFANDYKKQLWHTNCLVKLLNFATENYQALSSFTYSKHWISKLINASYLRQRNTKQGSKKNIQAHYDLSNHFYQLWLDHSMTYSSGIFLTESDTLEQAQQNKYQRILDLIPQHASVCEIGCGWGGFAQQCINERSEHYYGITLSTEQKAYCDQRLNNSRYTHIQDYRDLQGQYDVIVSIEMLEAVGQFYWGTYFKKIKQLLAPKGIAMIQTIVINDEYFADYARGTDMIRSYIFPGGMLPCPSKLNEHIQRAGLQIKDRYHFAPSYAKTLTNWLHSFNKHSVQLTQLGFNPAFQRLWSFYLAYCIAGFSQKRIDVVQYQITHADD